MFDFGLYFSKNKFPYNAILGNKIFDYSLANIPTLVLEEHSYINEFAEKNGIGFKVDPNKLDMHQINQLRNNKLSIDRIDSNLGYIKNNIIVMSYRANIVKGEGNAEEHLLIAEYIRKNLEKKNKWIYFIDN